MNVPGRKDSYLAPRRNDVPSSHGLSNIICSASRAVEALMGGSDIGARARGRGTGRRTDSIGGHAYRTV